MCFECVQSVNVHSIAIRNHKNLTLLILHDNYKMKTFLAHRDAGSFSKKCLKKVFKKQHFPIDTIFNVCAAYYIY